MTPDESLTEAVRIHDDDPWAARALLLSLPGRLTEAAGLARLAWLATHVLGGILQRWPEAALVCRQAATAARTPRADMLRSLAVSATLAGDALEAASAETDLAALLDASAADVAVLIRLAVIEQDMAKNKLARWLPLLDAAVARAEAIEGPGELVRLLAIVGNNSASTILDAVPAPTGEIARVMVRTAGLSFRCWIAVGSWVQHERAHYLMALASNATGEWPAAAAHARQGLALIAANDPEPIDSCFHHLALARALKALCDRAGSDAALAEAAALAPGFDAYWSTEYTKALAAL